MKTAMITTMRMRRAIQMMTMVEEVVRERIDVGKAVGALRHRRSREARRRATMRAVKVRAMHHDKS